MLKHFTCRLGDRIAIGDQTELVLLAITPSGRVELAVDTSQRIRRIPRIDAQQATGDNGDESMKR